MDTCKKLEETVHVHVRLLSQDSAFDLFNFFPKFKLSNSGCGLSASAAYMPVFTVNIIYFFQPSQDLNSILKKLSADGQLLAIDSDASDGAAQVFVVMNNEVFAEMSSYRTALFAPVAVHHVCNKEYPKI